MTGFLEQTISTELPRQASVADSGEVGTGPTRRRSRWGGIGLIALALLGSWAVPVGAHLLGIDWILPIVLLLALASLLRSGRTIVDRLILAFAILLGITPVAGLLISVWPWGLAPVPVAGCALSALVVIALISHRVPRFPHTVTGPSLVVALSGLVATLSVFWPLFGADFVNRFAVMGTGGDLSRHFSLHDAIRELGGYVFLDKAAVADSVWSAFHTYPQGIHLTSALLASFMRGTAELGSGVSELNTFLWFEPATYVVMCVFVIWAMGRLAGPALTGWTFIPPAALGLGYLLWGDPLTILWTGFWPEIAALGEFAVLLALLARPLHRTGEQLVVVAALLVAICFTYFLMLPIAVMAIGMWVLWFRRRLLKRRLLVAIVAIITAACAIVMPAVNLTSFNAGSHLTVGGSILQHSNRILAGFTAVMLVGLASRRWLRSVAWRSYVVHLAATLFLIGSIAGYQIYQLGYREYFYFKAVHILMIVVIVGLGACATLLAPVFARAGTGILAMGYRALVAGAIVGAIVVAVGPFMGLRTFAGSYMVGENSVKWLFPAKAAVAISKAFPERAGVMTLVYTNHGQLAHATAWSGAILRDNGVNWRAEMWHYNKPPIKDYFGPTGRPFRVISDNPKILEDLRRVQRENPDLRMEVFEMALPDN